MNLDLQSSEWNIDKNRVAAFGGSAGTQICMWLAFTDDMAKPDNTDPIERHDDVILSKAGCAISVLLQHCRQSGQSPVYHRMIRSVRQP